MLQVGDIVRVVGFFADFFPGNYQIESICPETGAFRICGGIDFDAVFLEKVT